MGLLPEHALRFPHEFSGGQRQRLCIARSLAVEPRLIVADESVSALDVSIKAQVINLMLDLQRELGLAFLFISHDIAIVERVSHRIAVMYLGEIVEMGPRQAVLGNPRHPLHAETDRSRADPGSGAASRAAGADDGGDQKPGTPDRPTAPLRAPWSRSRQAISYASMTKGIIPPGRYRLTV